MVFKMLSIFYVQSTKSDCGRAVWGPNRLYLQGETENVCWARTELEGGNSEASTNLEAITGMIYSALKMSGCVTGRSV